MADETAENFSEWERVYREHRGELPRAAVKIRWENEEKPRAFGKRSGDGDEWLRVVDGGFTGPSAYTLEPMPGFRGTLNRPPEQLYQIAKAAFSSDILLIGPMVGLYAAVTRKGKSPPICSPFPPNRFSRPGWT